MFQEADKDPQITVAVPPGLFVGVYREENLIKKDTIVIWIRSTQPHEMTAGLGEKSVGFKKGNYYSENFSGKKRWRWNWFDITKETGIAGSGDVTIHPRAIELPLKNIFDANRWW
jgi:hypothetical protein